jgi:site-specific recombinase XerD
MSSVENFVAQQRSVNTQRAYAADLRRLASFMGDRPVTDELVIAWRESLESELSNSAALRVFNTARSYYRWAEIEPNPFLRVKPPRKIEDWMPPVPAESDIDKVISICENPYHRVILNLLNNGLRAQEVVDLKKSSIWFEESVQGYILRVIGKGNKLRLVPATDETTASLANLNLLNGSDERLFNGLNTRKVYLIVDRYARDAKVEGMHPHAFRHAYATRLTRAGVGVLALQRLLGHARPDTTAKYVNLDLADLYAASRLDPRRIERPRLRIVS